MAITSTAPRLKSSNTSRSITAAIRRSIESGVFKDGDQLPPERELSETYSASRSTIRRALDELESLGLLDRQVGSGTFVTFRSADNSGIAGVAEQISPLQLIDARIGFERQMTRLAIAHATSRDFETMEELLIGMEAAETDKANFTRLDTDFHLALARASGNPLIVQLYNQINEVRTHAQWQVAREAVLLPTKIRQYNIHHRELLTSLRHRDVAGAIDALNKHMELAHEDLVGTFGDE